MGTGTFPKVSWIALASLTVFLAALHAAPAKAFICANDPSRTIFAGGPGTEACSQFNDEATCNKAFHRSGAGHLAQCAWRNDGCEGDTRFGSSCEQLPMPQTCIDPTRTIMLAGGTDGPNSGDEVCGTLTDQETCEMAWHTTVKSVGISCCWTGTGCEGSAFGFGNGQCAQRNTCFASTFSRTGAPALSTLGLVAIGLCLFAIGAGRLRPLRRSR